MNGTTLLIQKSYDYNTWCWTKHDKRDDELVLTLESLLIVACYPYEW